MKEAILADALHEADKPMARYRDDADLDARLREQERAEDPMLAYIKKKKATNAGPGTVHGIPVNISGHFYTPGFFLFPRR